ncbi:hypothetical protein JX266_005902 [Neoarthrinium moseri]|nr:hypothetical protein JX266_005902 [Neoarthrinium moseri]
MPKRKPDILDEDCPCQRPRQIRRMASTPVTTTIQLTAKEAQLKGLLLDVAEYINQTRVADEPVVLRWAGGWVRDKLLGIPSEDIDTAINVMTGEAFSSKIVELCEKPEVADKHGVSATDIGNLHKIAANPEKSKHLETTTIRLLGFDVDFVNLRKETYTDDSRNPQVEFGTAEEDALRRDATVNALFYNLNTARVEDFTSGLEDMRSKLIRTPLEPFQTFMDDPLRVLRLIRFASRLQFSIDPEAERVMADRRVLDALRIKISRERVGVEVEKMLKGNHPKVALERIDRLGLYHTVFTDPERPDMPQPEISKLLVSYECLEFLRQTKTPGSVHDVLVRSDEASYFSWVLAALTPWADVPDLSPTGKGKPLPPSATLAAREGIKAPNKLCDVITASHKHREEILSLKTAVCEKATYINERDRFGMAIRQWDARGGHWRLQVLSALLVDAHKVLGVKHDHAADTSFIAGWQLFLDHLQELDVMEAPTLKRIIDGTQLAKALGVKPGRWMAQALDVCVAWQLRNPDATDPAGAVEEVRSKKEELNIPM